MKNDSLFCKIVKYLAIDHLSLQTIEMKRQMKT